MKNRNPKGIQLGVFFNAQKGGDIINKREKEVELAKLQAEEKELKHLKAIYNKAADDIAKKLKISNGKINVLLKDFDELDDVQKSILQSQIYQRNFQLSLKKQIDGFLSDLQTDQYKSIDEYLKGCYETGFLGTMYDLHGQGIPLVFPIDQKQAAAAIKLDPKISKNLYTKLGEDVGLLKKRIANNVSRGIATASTYKEIARNIAADSNVGFNRAMRITRTEGHGVQVQAAVDAQYKAKDAGADVVKSWDAALDKRTRDSHRQVDGEIRELDEKFSNGMMYPSDPAGGAAEVVNCRCALLQRAKWALDEDELETLKERAKYYGLDKTKNFDDFKQKYLKAAEAEKMAVKGVADINKEGSGMLGNLYEKHRVKNGLTSIPYDELGDSANTIVGANYGKMSVESATAFNDAIKNLADEYDTPLQKIRTMTKDEFVMNSNSFAYVVHNYSVDSAELVINPAKCKDIGQLTDRIKELSQNGYCVKIPDEAAGKYVATHEFAHTLLNLEQPLNKKTNWLNADYGKITKARNEIKEVYEQYMAEVEAITAKQKKAEFTAMTTFDEAAWKAAADLTAELNAVKLSNYSLESADEFLAEAFANEKIGTTPNKYSKQVIDILDKHFKG